MGILYFRRDNLYTERKERVMTKKKVTPTQRRREVRESSRSRAMVEIKRLTNKYGRITVQYCLNQLRALEKKRERLAQLTKEAARLEREIK